MADLKHNGKPVKAIECKHVTHVVHPDAPEDIHFVKETIHYEDGTTGPATRIVKNFKRPFWLTKKAMRNHTQKKEFESIENVQRHMSTQVELVRSISFALNSRPPGRGTQIRDLADSPYLYGADMMSTTYLKYFHRKKFGEITSAYNIAVLDTETDVVNGTEEIIMITISYKGRVYTGIVESYMDGMLDPINRLHKTFNKYLGAVEMIRDKKKGLETVNVIEERGIKWEVEILPTSIDIVKAAFARAHAWQPDLMAYWNMRFDVNKILETCKKYDYPPEYLFSDPSIPVEYKYFRFKEGPDKRITESGVVKTIEPSENWHTVFAPASFYHVDAMCVYRKLRIADGKENGGYGLDNILTNNIGARKLKFAETDHLSGLRWHIEMQKNFKLEYVVYNVFDCVSIEILDEKTKDLQVAFPSQCGCSDFSLFPSQPKRLCDGISFFIENEALVWGTTGPNMYTEFDDMTTSNKGWIVTLPAHLVADNGLQCIEEYPELRTNIRTHFGDLDVSASYPNNGSVFNISKRTTVKELCAIKNVPEELRRTQGLNLSGGKVNAVEFCTSLLSLPMLPELLDEFTTETGGK